MTRTTRCLHSLYGLYLRDCPIHLVYLVFTGEDGHLLLAKRLPYLARWRWQPIYLVGEDSHFYLLIIIYLKGQNIRQIREWSTNTLHQKINHGTNNYNHQLIHQTIDIDPELTLIHSFIQTFIQSFIQSFTHFIHSFVHSFIAFLPFHSIAIHAFTHSLINLGTGENLV